MPTVPRTAGGGPCLAASSLPHGPPGVGKQLDLVNGQVSRPLQHRTPLELYLAAQYERNSFVARCSRFAVELRHNGASEADNASTMATPEHSTTTIKKGIRIGVMAAELNGGEGVEDGIRWI